jgi:hypothetical protein
LTVVSFWLTRFQIWPPQNRPPKTQPCTRSMKKPGGRDSRQAQNSTLATSEDAE